jgi:hypothetical protein
MTEGITDVVVEPTTQPTPPLVNADGELREGWRDTLPEDIRGEKVFDRVSNFEGAMKSLASAEKMVGKDKIPIPTEASSEAEWDAYYVAGGRPETAADYNLARPEELPEEYYSQELASAAQELFHKIGLSKKQADMLFAFNNNSVIAQLAKNTQDAELSATELKDGLYADWGNAFEQKKHLGNVAMEEAASTVKDGVKVVDPEFKERLVQKAGNDPDIIRAFANLGSKFAEAGSVTIDVIPTPGDIQVQIDEIVGSKAYSADYVKHGFTREQHKAAVEKAAALFRAKTPEVKTG